MMVKSGLDFFLKFLHGLTIFYQMNGTERRSFGQKYKFSNKNDIVSTWRNFKCILSRPLFAIIYRPEILKFHPYCILTGDTMTDLSYTTGCKATSYATIFFKKCWFFAHEKLKKHPQNVAYRITVHKTGARTAKA